MRFFIKRFFVSVFLASGLITPDHAQAANLSAANPADTASKSPVKSTDSASKPAASDTMSQSTLKPLNRSEVLSLYMSGEFETLVSLLENIRRERRMRDKEDSAFIYKFLGVIYGANEGTRKKAEAFLYQMLKLQPQSDLSALGVGDSVEAIFERVRLRFGKAHEDSLAALGIVTPQPAATKAPAASSSASAAAPVAASAAAEPDKKRGIPKWVWITGGGVAAAALTGVILLSQEPEPRVHDISRTLE